MPLSLVKYLYSLSSLANVDNSILHWPGWPVLTSSVACTAQEDFAHCFKL